MSNYPINYNLYTYFWKKYLPAIVKLMVDAANGPQQYQFAQHEFKDINAKEKGGHTFTLEAFKGKATNNIKPSVVAQDLLLSIRASGRAIEMMETATYTFILDKQFLLHITREAIEEEIVEEETVEKTKEEETAADSAYEVQEEKPEKKIE